MTWVFAYLIIGLFVGYAVLATGHSWHPRKLIVHRYNLWVFPLAAVFWLPGLLLFGYDKLRHG